MGLFHLPAHLLPWFFVAQVRYRLSFTRPSLFYAFPPSLPYVEWPTAHLLSSLPPSIPPSPQTVVLEQGSLFPTSWASP